MTNEIIAEGLLILYDPNASQKFTVQINNTNTYLPAQVFEDMILSALNRVHDANTQGRSLFSAMIAAGDSAAEFAIGSIGSASNASTGKYDFQNGGQTVAQGIHGMKLGIGDIIGGENYGQDTGHIATQPDIKLYMGKDGAFHANSAERVLVHELSHNVLQTRDVSEGSILFPLAPIDYQNSNTDYYTDYQGVISATEFANEVMIDLSEVEELSYFGKHNYIEDQSPAFMLDGFSYSGGNAIDFYYSGQGNSSNYNPNVDTIDARHKSGNGIILGRDQLHSQIEKEYIFSGDGNDYIYADRFADFYSVNGSRILGGTVGTADVVSAGAGDDTIYLGAGDDVLLGDLGNDTVYGGLDTDTVDYSGFTEFIDIFIGADQADEAQGLSDRVIRVYGTNSFDQLYSIEEIKATNFLDNIVIIDYLESGYDLTIDGNGGQTGVEHGLINATSNASGFKLGFQGNGDYVIQSADQTSGILTLKNFNTEIRGTADADTVVFEVGSLTATAALNIEVDLGAGADTVVFKDTILSDPSDLLKVVDLGSSPVSSTNADTIDVTAITDDRIVVHLGTQSDPDIRAGIYDYASEGSEFIVGIENANIVKAGAGTQILFANGGRQEDGEGYSVLYGGDGIDFIQGDGWESHLYGGEGSDLFGLASSTFVEDATTDDFIMWGPFRITGGVQQWWMEGGLAHWTPFTSITNAISGPASPLSFVDSYLTMAMDVAFMSTFAFGLSDTNQLLVRLGKEGYALQSVVENYDLDLDTGRGTGNIAVYRQVTVDRSETTLADYRHNLNLALYAGFGQGLAGMDPLALDLDGDGLELSSIRGNSIYFELDGDGFAERMGWVKSDDGLLAHDVNGNGTIDDITELFGDADTSGFTALAAFDSNSDGVINALDTGFGDLRVWQDLDQDGVTDAGELKTLTEHGITEISLTTTTPTDSFIAGNDVTADGVVTRADGSQTKISDVAFSFDQTDTRYLGDTTVSTAAAALPNLKGYGELTTLAVAMTNDATLLTAVSDFDALAATTGYATLQSDTESILYRWAGVDGVAATAMGADFDERKLAFLEAYLGHELAPRDLGGVPLQTNVAELIETWDDILGKTTLKLAAQGPLTAIFTGAPYEVESDRFLASTVTTLVDAYVNAFNQLSADAPTALIEWQDHWGPLLAEYTEAMVRSDGNETKVDFSIASMIRAMGTVTSPLSLAALAAGLGYADVEIGTAGADTLTRTSTAQTVVYIGDSGDDTMTGGVGQDVYVFGENFGTDTIFDAEGSGTQSGDRLRFPLLTRDEVTIERQGIDLIVTVIATGDQVIVKNQFETPTVSLGGEMLSNNWGVEDIQFADGEIYETLEIAAATGLGTIFDDTLIGTSLNDELEGLEGNDLLQGGDSGDKYYYKPGHGHDIIHDVMTNVILSDPDVLFFGDGIFAGDLILDRDGKSDDLLITFADPNDSILVKDQFAYTALGFHSRLSPDNRIEAVFFQQGAAWSWVDIQQRLISKYTTDGDDITYGFGTSDVIRASAGNGTLSGLDGGDEYHFGIGSGNDIIFDDARYVDLPDVGGLPFFHIEGTDVLVFDGALTAADVTFARSSANLNDLVITIDGTTDTLTIVDQFDGRAGDIFGLLGMLWFDRVEEFHFSDDTVLTWGDVMETITAEAMTDGDDTIIGFHYQDTLDGGLGNDTLSGGDDNDTYLFGLGYGNDTIEDAQSDLLTASVDKVVFGAGITAADVSYSRIGNAEDLIISLAGDTSTLTIIDQFDVSHLGIFGPDHYDRIETFEFADGTIVNWDTIAEQLVADAKTSGDDTIYSFDYEDTLDGGAGNDLLVGGNANDVYVFGTGYGSDTIDEQRTDLLSGDFDIVSFNADVAVADALLERGVDRNDLVIRLAGTTDDLTIKNTFYQSTIGSLIDHVEEYHFADGTIWTLNDIRLALLDIESTSGDDLIRGFGGDDRLDGGAGNDRLEGWDGDDTYVFGSGYGQDVIYDEPIGVGGGENRVEFTAEITTSDLILSRSGDDLTIAIDGTTDTLTIEDQFLKFSTGPRYYEIAAFHFNDGTIWSVQDVQDRLLQATAGDDLLIGFETDDILDGGVGNDRMEGLGGNDTYAFDAGQGNDVIRESLPIVNQGDFDVVNFGSGIAVSDVSGVRSGDDLILTIVSTGDTLTLEDYYFGTGYHKVEEFRFTDGTVWTETEIDLLVSGLPTGPISINGTAASETLDGTVDDEILDGKGGDDTLKGNAGSDIYLYASGDGNDLIFEFDDVGVDTLRFTDLNIADLSFAPSGGSIFDLAITVTATGHTITIDDQFSNSNSGLGQIALEQIEFADGTTWSRSDILLEVRTVGTSAGETIVGGDSAEGFEGGLGDDTLKGGKGGDLYLYAFGDGDDVILDNSTGSLGDQLRLTGIATGDVTLTRGSSDKDDVTLSFAGGGSVKLDEQFHRHGWQTIETVVFDDGTVWTDPDIRVALLDQASTAGNDDILGFASDDVLEGGLGDDTLEGSRGSDTYVYTLGDGADIVEDKGSGSAGDKLVLHGIATGDVTLSRATVDADDVTLSFAGGGSVMLNEQLSYLGFDTIEQIVFDDGTIWTDADIKSMLLAQASTTGDDTIVGYGDDDTLQGGLGNDTLEGGRGGDTYVYASGDGNDLIDDGLYAGTDRLHLTDLNASDVSVRRLFSNLNDMAIIDYTTGFAITVDDQFRSGNYGLEQIEFADGTIWSEADILANAWILGTSGSETITGTADGDNIYADAGDDILDGDAGNDRLEGAAGADTYIFNVGDGADVINDQGSQAETDILDLGAGITAASVQVERGVADFWNMRLIFGGGDEVTVEGHFIDSNYYVEEIHFDDGTVWTQQDTREHYIAQHATAGDDTINGFHVADVIDAGDGNDTVYGYSGDDIITGGLGDDFLEGLQGADTYHFNLGDGSDRIQEWTDPTDGNDKVVFGAGITTGMVTVDRAADGFFDLVLTIGSGGDAIRIDNHFNNAWEQVEEFHFDGGTVWTTTDVADSYFADQKTTGDDNIDGFFTDDTIDGGDGNDSLYGYSGDDRLIGGNGNDFMVGDGGNDTFVFADGDDYDWINGFQAGAGSDDVIELVQMAGFTQFSDVIAAASDSGGNTQIDFGGDGITLAGVSVASLHEDDFRFV